MPVEPSLVALVVAVLAASVLSARDPALADSAGVRLLASVAWPVAAALVHWQTSLLGHDRQGAQWSGALALVLIILVTRGRPVLVMDQLLEDIHVSKQELRRGRIAAGVAILAIGVAVLVLP